MGMRFILVTLVLTLLLGALVSCGSSNTQAPKLTVNVEAFGEGDEQLRSIALMLASAEVYTKTHEKYTTHEMLVAASRGYDMLAPGFDDSKVDPEAELAPDLDAVVRLIEAANAKAGAETKILNNKYKDIITEESVERLVNSLKQTVATEPGNGVIDVLLGWIGTALKWITNLFGGVYLIGICVFAVIIELLMLPMSIKQHKTSIKQAKIKPKEMAIRKKYAGRDDQATRQKMATEMQELYQRENVSAASGCLPLLIQLPIILALYQIVIDPLHYVLGQAPGVSNALALYYTTSKAAGGIGAALGSSMRGSISILSGINESGGLEGIKSFGMLANGGEVYSSVAGSGYEALSFKVGPLNLGEIPSLSTFNWLLLIPVLTFVVYFFSMRLTKKFTYQPSGAMMGADGRQAACSGWMMDIMMPLMSVYITFMVPALIGVYWIFKSIISTLSRFILTRVMPYPQFTEEDYRAAEREYAGKAPKKQAPGQYAYSKDTKMVGGKPKSLFHMDDDDYMAKVAEESAEQEKDQPADTRVEGETLKKDDRPAKQEKKDDGE